MYYYLYMIRVILDEALAIVLHRTAQLVRAELSKREMHNIHYFLRLLILIHKMELAPKQIFLLLVD